MKHYHTVAIIASGVIHATMNAAKFMGRHAVHVLLLGPFTLESSFIVIYEANIH